MGSLRRARARPRRRPLTTRAASGRHRAWRVLERRATPAVLHGERAGPARRTSRLRLRPPRSGRRDRQRAAGVRLRRAKGLRPRELDLVRRRSGGGAVLVAPGVQVWLDVFVPNDDALAQPDVGKSFHWLGDAFAAAIASVLGTSAEQAGVEVNRGPRQSHSLVQNAVLRGTRSRRGDRRGTQGRRDVAAEGALGCVDPLDGAPQRSSRRPGRPAGRSRRTPFGSAGRARVRRAPRRGAPGRSSDRGDSGPPALVQRPAAGRVPLPGQTPGSVFTLCAPVCKRRGAVPSVPDAQEGPGATRWGESNEHC